MSNFNPYFFPHLFSLCCTFVAEFYKSCIFIHILVVVYTQVYIILTLTLLITIFMSLKTEELHIL